MERAGDAGVLRTMRFSHHRRTRSRNARSTGRPGRQIAILPGSVLVTNHLCGDTLAKRRLHRAWVFPAGSSIYVGALCSPSFCSRIAVPQAQGGRLTDVAGTIDGDTIEILGHHVLLHGMDAPKSAQLCATAAGQCLRCKRQTARSRADRISHQQVSNCPVPDVDRHGRFIAVCHQDGTDLNGWLVREGWAVAYRRYSRDYIRDETEARSARRDIWSGRFDMLWDWRRAQRGG